jgi:hypothetical protein
MGWFFFSLLGCLILALGILFAIGSVNRAAKVRALSRMPEVTRLELIALVESIGNAPSRGYIGLLERQRIKSDQLTLFLPTIQPDFPWSGSHIRITLNDRKTPDPIRFQMSNNTAEQGELSAENVTWLAIPAIAAEKKKRVTNVYSLERYMKLSPALSAKLSELYPSDPVGFLSTILSVDGDNDLREPPDTMRCGLPPAWIQTARFHKCDLCKRPMRLILQVPSYLFDRNFHDNGAFFLFGCPSHPERTIQDQDWY